MKITKQDIGFNLEDLEREAASVYEEGDENIENITTEIGNLAVTARECNGAETGMGDSKGDKVDSEGKVVETRGNDIDSDDTSCYSSDSECSDDDTGSDRSDSEYDGNCRCENKVDTHLLNKNKEHKFKDLDCETEISGKPSNQSADSIRCTGPLESNDSDKLKSVMAVLVKRHVESGEETKVDSNPECGCITKKDDENISVRNILSDSQDVNETEDDINKEEDIT